MSNPYVLLVLTQKPDSDKSGDDLAREMIAKQPREVGYRLVPRTEVLPYQYAMARAERNAKRSGYSFRVIDADEALIEVTIPKGTAKHPFYHRLRKFVRVLQPRHLGLPAISPVLVSDR